jgi:hypothetical protein
MVAEGGSTAKQTAATVIGLSELKKLQQRLVPEEKRCKMGKHELSSEGLGVIQKKLKTDS